MEYHFVIECSMYIEQRKYIPVYFWKRPSMPKVVNLITTINANHLRKLGIFFLFIKLLNIDQRYYI